jgi:hypothetical protein
MYLFRITMDGFSYNMVRALHRTRPPNVCGFEFYTVNRNYMTAVQTSGYATYGHCSEIVPTICAKGTGVFYFGLRGWSAICLSLTFSFHAIYDYYSQLHKLNVHTVFLDHNFSATKTGFCLVQIQFWTGFNVCLLTRNIFRIPLQAETRTNVNLIGIMVLRHQARLLLN